MNTLLVVVNIASFGRSGSSSIFLCFILPPTCR